MRLALGSVMPLPSLSTGTQSRVGRRTFTVRVLN
jgi:hypothetical protein